MADKSTGAPRKKSWGRRLGIFAGTFLALLVVLYLVVTSGAFFKSVIAPKIGDALNANFQAESANVRPFSGVTLKQVKVQTTGPEPLLIAEEIRVRHSLGDILGGKITLHELTIVSPVITVVQNPDGTSNLDPLFAKAEEEPGEDGESKTDEPTQIAARNIAIQNGVIRHIQKADSGTTHTELGALNLTIDQLGNGLTSKLDLASGVKMDQTGGTNTGVLQAALKGGLRFALDATLAPQSASGKITLNTQRAEGAFATAREMNADVTVDITPSEVRNLSVAFQRAGSVLGELRASGPFDMAKTEGRLNISLVRMDRSVLEFFTVGEGMKFGASRLSSTNVLTLAQSGAALSLDGALSGRGFSVTMTNGVVSPELDLDAAYTLSVNVPGESAIVQRFNISGRQQNREILTSRLSAPMSISWGAASNAVPDSSLELVLTNINLADWKAVLPTNAPTGRIGARALLAAQRGGQLLRADVVLRAQNLTAQIDETNQLSNAQLAFNATGALEEFKRVQVDSFNFTLDQGNQPLARGTGAAQYDLEKTNLNARLDVEAALAQTLAVIPVADLQARNGVLRLNARVEEGSGARKIEGVMVLTNFTGSYAEYQFEQFTTTADLDLTMRGDVVDISKANLRFASAGQPGGEAALSGRANIATKAAALTYQLNGLNQRTLEPFLASALGTNELVSVTLNSKGKSEYHTNGATVIQGDLSVENLVVNQGTNRIGPLGLASQLDAGLANEILDVRKLNVKLSPTARATNLLEVKGRIGLNKTNAPPGTLTIASSSMDVTPFYELFAGNTNAAPAEVPATDAADGPALEPEPIELPFRDLAVDLRFDRFYLRDLAISNWTGSIKIKTNTVTVDPFRLALNGAPVSASARVDLSVPGYRYDLAFDANRAPLDPIATTFLNSAKGQYAGDLIASVKIKGAGTTGASLQKSLEGDIDVIATNLNLQVVDLEQSKKLKRWANLGEVILRQVGVLLQIPDLLQSPINLVRLDVGLGGGQVKLSGMHILSQAFTADTQGAIPIQPVLTNSPLDLPLQLALRRFIAERSRIAGVLNELAPPGTPTNSAYVPLPTFVRIAGTVGNPKPDIDEKRLFKGAILGTVGRALQGEGELGRSLQNLLGGNRDPGTNAPANAAPSTNAPNVGESLLRGFGGLLNRGAPNTNNAATNAPAQTNQPARVNPFDLLRGLQNKPQQ